MTLTEGPLNSVYGAPVYRIVYFGTSRSGEDPDKTFPYGRVDGWMFARDLDLIAPPAPVKPIKRLGGTLPSAAAVRGLAWPMRGW